MTQNAKVAGVRLSGKPLLKRIWNYRVIDLMLLPMVLNFVLFKCRAVWGMKLPSSTTGPGARMCGRG